MNTILNYMLQSPEKQVLQPKNNVSQQKMIVLNMESVMKSLKKREKHKRHKQKKLKAALEKDKDSPGNNGGHESESDEPLSRVKQALVKRRFVEEMSKDDSPDVSTEQRKNAFDVLMVGGKGNRSKENTITNGENGILAGKRKPDVASSAAKIGSVKRRKVKDPKGNSLTCSSLNGM